MGKGFIGSRQTTLASEIELTGTGVHSGAPVSITLHPAEANVGIRFIVIDGSDIETEIVADYRAVSNVTLCTILSDGNGGSVATVEHLLAAIRGLCIDNVIIEIDRASECAGAEVPIMDGSAAPFVQAIDEVGIRELGASRKFIKVLKPIRVEDSGCWGELFPHSGFHLDIEIDFEAPIIGRQRRTLEMNPGAFRAEVSRARTFGFMREVEQLWAAGRALGASLENTVALGDNEIINREGLRYSDEFVRHKMLDAIGDLALAGAPLLGGYRSYRGGHRLNSLALKSLFADRDAWTLVHAPSFVREPARVGAPVGVAAASFAADRN